MKTETDLPDGIGVEILTDKKSYAYIGYCVVDKNGNHVQSLSPGLEKVENTLFFGGSLPEEFQHLSGIYGTIAMEKLSTWEDPDCDGAFIIVNSVATSGYGPLLYDVAIEYASTIGSGLVSDRYNVSADAAKIWKKYAKRGDVDQFQCDDENNTLTPIDSDNLEQHAARKTAPAGSNFTASPLSKRYSKKPERMNGLESLGKLVFIN
mgnify:FL=1|jgi:hypothetical protein|tara:strand:- start:494 stop:1114 length:621 start_codon:yes stop_codon:yes gene_type:complete